MKDVVSNLIELLSNGKVDVRLEFIEHLMIEYIHNEFNVPYEDINIDITDLKTVYDTLNQYYVAGMDRTKVSKLIALTNLITYKYAQQ